MAHRGKDLLLKVADAAGVFITVAGLRARTLAFNAATVDATHAESAAWRELLAATGVRSARLTGSGLFKDAASDARVRALFFAGEHVRWQAIVPDFGTIEGAFQIVSLEFSGTHENELTFEIGLESAGALTFTEAA